MRAINMIKEVVNNDYLKSILSETFGEIEDYRITYTLSEKGEIKYINLNINVKEDISNNINLIKLAKYLNDIYEYSTNILSSDYTGPFMMKINSECEYSGESVDLGNLSGSYDDDDWCDFDEPEYLGTNSIRSGYQTFLVDISRYYSKFILDISIEEADSPIESNISIDVILSYNKEDIRAIIVEYDKEKASILDKNIKLELANLIKELNKELNLNLDEIDIQAEDKSYTNLISDLQKVTDSKIVNKLFKNMKKFAKISDFEVTMFIGEDGDCKVRYFNEGYGFSWNHINREEMSDNININIESQIFDKSDRNFWSRKFKNEISYHSNDIIDGKVNDYAELMRSKLVTALVTQDDKHKIPKTTFSVTLNKGFIQDIIELGQYIYGFNSLKEIIFVSRDINMYDLNKLKKIFNDLILDTTMGGNICIYGEK